MSAETANPAGDTNNGLVCHMFSERFREGIFFPVTLYISHNSKWSPKRGCQKIPQASALSLGAVSLRAVPRASSA